MSAVFPISRSLDAAVGVPDKVNPDQSAKTARRTSSTLLLRLALLNILAFSMVGAAWWEGYVATVLDADKTRLSVLIFVVFMVGLIISGWRAVQINREIEKLNKMSRTTGSEDSGDSSEFSQLLALVAQGSMGALRLRLTHRIASVRHIANVLVLLGLIGTVLGFIIALSGVDPDSASDIEGIAPMVSTLIQGMSTALYTTLIGSILNVWLSANYQMLSSGTVELMSLWIEADEQSKSNPAQVTHA